MSKMLLIFGGLTLVAACQKPADQARIEPPTQTEAQKIVDALDESYASGDANRIMGHYAEGASMFDVGLLAPVTDRQMQTKITQGFAAMQPRDFTVANGSTQILDADTFVSSGVATYTVQLGQSRQPIRARFSQVYQRQADQSWKIVHEHMSAPPAGSPMP